MKCVQTAMKYLFPKFKIRYTDADISFIIIYIDFLLRFSIQKMLGIKVKNRERKRKRRREERQRDRERRGRETEYSQTVIR